MLVILFVFPQFFIPVTADEKTNNKEINIAQQEGKVSAKDEVVYAKLTANGKLDNIYVVNIFDIAEKGVIIDYGMYESVKNLTDLSYIEQSDNAVQFTANDDKFYYQGNMNQGELPWNFTVTYYLNGREIAPEEIAGKDGSFQIKIKTTRNEQVDPAFYESFMLQISVSLDSEKFENIKVDDASIANIGKNKQITFTVMPQKDENFEIEGDVTDFELAGIEIAAVPMSMSIDTPNMDEMAEEMETLSDAISQLYEGVSELKFGVSQLNDGVEKLTEGSKAYKDGMNEVDGASNELVQASEKINEALEMISSQLSLDNKEEMEISQLLSITDALNDMSDGLSTLSEYVFQIKEGYSQAYPLLKQTIDEIELLQLSEAELGLLMQSGVDRELIKKLIKNNEIAKGIKILFEGDENHPGSKEVFDKVEPLLDQVYESTSQISKSLDQISEGLTNSFANMESLDIHQSLEQLNEGLTELSNNYGKFHEGLVAYTEGISALTSSYEQLHSGITELSSGTNELDTGVAELHDGTKQLHDATKEIPEQMESKVDQMMSDYDKSDYEPISFVSKENNEIINSVQFIIRTESIKKEEVEITEENEEEEQKGFWTLLLNLFK